MAIVLEKGSITLTTKDLLRYAVDCNSFMKDIGDYIIKSVVVPSSNGYLLVFYPFEKDSYDSFFDIKYDKDLNFEFYTKTETNISKDMRYVVLKS